MGSVVALLLFNGSDACAAVGESLLIQSVQNLLQHLNSIFAGAASTRPQQLEVGENQHLDNAIVERILLSMKEARECKRHPHHSHDLQNEAI